MLATALALALNVTSIETGWEALFNGQYAIAEREAIKMRWLNPCDLESYDLRMVAIIFELKEVAIVEDKDGDVEKRNLDCPTCKEALRSFADDYEYGVRLARQRLIGDPEDVEGNFYLAKFHLNRLWYDLKIRGKREGLGRFKEARQALELVLKKDPAHPRALIASAWLEYGIAKQNFLVRMFLGGGSKELALARIGTAISCYCQSMPLTEARFAFLEMLKQEKRISEAKALAQSLREQFPGNARLAYE